MEVEQLMEALAETSERISDKERELKLLRLDFASLKAQAREAEETAASGESPEMRQTVHELVHGQLDTAAACNSYENRVIALELQSLVDRYKLLDVEGLATQNHELREEIMALQQENFKLIESLAEGDTRARQHTAKIELALEATARAHFRQSHESIRKQLYEQMDHKTKMLVHEHGALQTQVKELNKQAGLIDDRYRKMSTERQQFKIDAHVADGMNDIMSKQNVTLRRQLDQAHIMNQLLEQGLERSHFRAKEAEAQLSRAMRQRQQHAQGYSGEEGSEAELSGVPGHDENRALQQQLEQCHQLQAKLRTQRDLWRDRCQVHEKTIAGLQARLQESLDKNSLRLPTGLQQSTGSIWCADQVLSSVLPSGAPARGRGAADGRHSPAASEASGTLLQGGASPRSQQRLASGQLQAQPQAGTHSTDAAGDASGRGAHEAGPGGRDEQVEVDAVPPATLDAASGAAQDRRLEASPSSQQHDAGSSSPRGRELLSGTVSLSRLLNDAMEPMHVVYPSVTQTLDPNLIRAHRSPGSLRYSCSRTSMVELYQGLEKAGTSRPVSASAALAMDKKLWQQRLQARCGDVPQSSGSAAPEQSGLDQAAACKANRASRPMSAMPMSHGALGLGQASRTSGCLPVRPATACIRPGAPQRIFTRAGAAPMPGIMFKNNASLMRADA